MLFDGKYDKAIPYLRKSLQSNAELAQAHNNLAFCLRKQGADYFEEALKHYNKAIELQEKLPEPYMYRGVLYVQMGKLDRAQQDLAVLKKLESPLGSELQWVIENGKEKEPDSFFGVSQSLKK